MANTTNINELKEKLVSTFKEIKLSEMTHTYTIGAVKYKSVSNLIKELEPPFNEYIVAEQMAKAHNAKIKETGEGEIRTKEWYIKYWNSKSTESRAKGNRVHMYAESYPELTEPSCEKETGVRDWLLNTKYIKLFSEFKVYSKKYKIAGTIDLLMYNPETDSLVIVDWKTNAVNLHQVYGKKKFKEPLLDTYATSFNKYRLQLSLYASMLEEAGFKVSNIHLVWLCPRHVETKEGYYVENITSNYETDYYKSYDLVRIDASKVLDYKEQPKTLSEIFKEKIDKKQASLKKKLKIKKVKSK